MTDYKPNPPAPLVRYCRVCSGSGTIFGFVVPPGFKPPDDREERIDMEPVCWACDGSGTEDA